MHSDCNLCVNGFDAKQDLQNHMIIQHGNKPIFNISNCQGKYIETKPETNGGRKELQKNAGNNIKTDMEVNDKIVYKCYVCGKSFPKYSTAKDHVILHKNQKGKIDISNCEEKYQEMKPGSSEGMKEPTKTSGNTQRVYVKKDASTLYKCDVCRRSFLTFTAAEDHVMIHNDGKEKPYQLPSKCDECGKCFQGRVDLERHLRIHSGEKPFKCSVCGRLFRQASTLRTHSFIHSDERPYTCETCGITFKNVRDIKRHSIVHTDERPNRSRCNTGEKLVENPFDCKEEEYQKMTPETHKVIKEPQKTYGKTDKKDVKEDSNTLYKCDVCGQSFSKFTEARDHMTIHYGDKDKSYMLPSNHKCEECGKSFQRPDYLAHHSLIHTGEKPHKCDVCGKRFTHPSTLRKHALVHSDEKPHKCESCGKTFRHFCALKAHLMIHTGERNHKCELCGKSFRQASTVGKHALIHSGEKPHQCEICGQCFRNISNFKKHLKSHGGEMPQ